MKNKRHAPPDTGPQRKQRKNETEPIEPVQNNGLTVVGIGASAGGLKALQTFFDTLPNNTGLAFVVITHLHPEHESHLAEILQKNTKMRVRQVTREVHLEPNHIYVIPPNRSILITDTTVDIEEFHEMGGMSTLVNDRTDGVVVGFVDISEIKKAQRTQRDYESFYTLFHANPIPTILTRLEDNVVMNVNHAFLDYLNLQREDVVGHTMGEFNLGLDLESVNRANLAAKLLKDGSIRNFEEKIALPDGAIKAVMTSLQYINIENTDALISTFIDITERVRAERQIRKLSVQLTTAEQEERNRISQILHDDLQQRIFAVKMQLENTEEALRNNNLQSAKTDFAKLEEWLTEAIAITRQLSADLGPLDLQSEGLREVILWLSAQMKEQYGLEVKLDADEIKTRFESHLQIVMFHAIRELLFNVVKHARTLQAQVSLRQVDNEWVCIQVNDEGVGFDPAAVLRDENLTHGLAYLRQRLMMFGCKLEVDSALDRGTRVTMDCPLRALGSQS